MNNNYLGLVLATTSLIFETFYEGIRRVFCVKYNDNLKLSLDGLSFRDCIEDKIFTLGNDTLYLRVVAKADVLPSLIECINYDNYVEAHKSEIDRNNTCLAELFKEISDDFSAGDSAYNTKIKYIS